MVEAGLAARRAWVEIEPDVTIANHNSPTGACQSGAFQAENIAVEITLLVAVAADDGHVLHLCKHRRAPYFRRDEANLIERRTDCQPHLTDAQSLRKSYRGSAANILRSYRRRCHLWRRSQCLLGTDAVLVGSPPRIPIQILKSCESLFIIVRKWLVISVTGIIVSTAALSGKLN